MSDGRRRSVFEEDVIGEQLRGTINYGPSLGTHSRWMLINSDSLKMNAGKAGHGLGDQTAQTPMHPESIKTSVPDLGSQEDLRRSQRRSSATTHIR